MAYKRIPGLAETKLAEKQMVMTRRTLEQKKDENGPGKKENSTTTTKDQTAGYNRVNIYKAVMMIVCGALAYHYYYSHCGSGMPTLASVHENVATRREMNIPCSQDYVNDLEQFKGCAPKTCGRFVKDGIVSDEEAKQLLNLVKKGMSFGGSDGGASILDLHSGALSKGDQFVNIFGIIRSKTEPVFQEADFIIYRNMKNRIKKEIADTFEIPVAKLHLTKPTFFSRMTTKPAKTIHDEYWHPHIDKEQYGSFHYTSLVYLSNYGSDFTGGRFVFVDEAVNKTVEPKMGRVSFFTSGSENVHYVEKLQSGTRYAVTVSFTCDPKHMIPDPRLPPSKPKPTLQAKKPKV